MDAKFLKTILFSTVIVGGLWILFHRDQIKQPADILSLLQKQIPVESIGFTQTPSNQDRQSATSRPVSPQFVNNVIRVASLKINDQSNQAPAGSPLEILADIGRQFDVIAIQGIATKDHRWLNQLTHRMNAMGAVGTTNLSASPKTTNGQSQYVYAIDRDQKLNHAASKSAFIFNRQTVDLVQSQFYSVNDPDDILKNEPLVGWFQTRGPNPNEAFTFSLVSVDLDSKRPDLELAYLNELFRVIRDDGRGEDDVIMVGNFNAGDRGLQTLSRRAGLAWVISNQATDIAHRTQLDNVLFYQTATTEFTGRGGVYNFPLRYQLTADQAKTVSRHLPVWAEFSIIEGGSRAPLLPPDHFASEALDRSNSPNR